MIKPNQTTTQKEICMNNLKLITTENFGNISCDFYRNMNNDILLTREQIGTALEYTNPSKAIQQIHLRHKDRLEPLCLRIKEIRHPQSEGTGIEVETVYYTERGIMELCRWSTKRKANQFMDWCWDVIEKYRNNQGFTNTIDATAINTLTQAITALTSTVSTMQQDIATMKEQQSQAQKQLPKKPFKNWTKKMLPKYKLLANFFEVSLKELYHNLYVEFQNLYPDIDLAQIQEDYCFENGLESCYTMDAIEHNKEIRTLFEHMVNDLLDRYKLKSDSDEEYTVRKTIFV